MTCRRDFGLHEGSAPLRRGAAWLNVPRRSQPGGRHEPWRTRGTARGRASDQARARAGMAAATPTAVRQPEQEDRAGHLGAGAVPRVLGNARQERADQRAELPDRSLEPVEFLPGEDHPPHAHDRRRPRPRRSNSPRRPTRPARPRSAKQIDEWTKTAARYRSEPEAGGGKGEGTRRADAARAGDGERIAICALEQVPRFRICLGCAADRHRAGFGGGHHRHDRSGVARRRPRSARPRCSSRWASVLPARASSMPH